MSGVGGKLARFTARDLEVGLARQAYLDFGLDYPGEPGEVANQRN